MGLFTFFKIKENDAEENDLEREIERSKAIRKRLVEEMLEKEPKNSESNKDCNDTEQKIPMLQKTELSFSPSNFHPDVKDLIWFADGPLKNINAGQSIRQFSSNGITITCSVPGMEEPSQIFTRMPVELPNDVRTVDRPPYYPTYAELTPLQKGAYLKWLENPYNPEIDIGFVFILYYGLERHLLCGNEEKALEVILKLRDVHTNKSFQQYSASASILTAIHTGKGEFAISFLRSLDKEHEINNFPANLYLICASSLNLHMFASDIVRISSWFGFDNRLYIKKYPDIFINTLSEEIEKLKQRKYLLVSDFLSEYDINAMTRHEVTIFANTSLRDTKVSIPFITESEKMQSPIFNLLQNTHDTVKAIISEKRKRGELPKEQKKEAKHRDKKTMPQLIKELQQGTKSIPLPSGYSTSIRALRGMKKLDSNNSEEYLKQMYELAVQYSMCVPYSEYCECPGFNIFESIPAHEIEELKYTYNEIGYEELELLSITDIREMTELWGEPDSHSTLNKMYSALWHKYEIRYKKENPF